LATTHSIQRQKNQRTKGIKALSKAAITANTAAITTSRIGSSIIPNIPAICLKRKETTGCEKCRIAAN
jgi:hypothetical protein